MPHIAGIGVIKGIDAEDSVAAQKRIFLFDRTNMKLVAQAVSDVTGGYAFNGLNAETTDYLIFSVDDNGSPRKQPIIYDYVQPIPAQQGETFWGNYYKLVMADAPAAGFFGFTDNQGVIDTIADAPPDFVGNTLTPNLSSVTPGAPLLPVTSVASGAIGIRPRGNGGYRFDNTPCKVSLEWTFDRAGTTTTTNLLANINTSSSSYDQTGSTAPDKIAVLSYDPSSKVLTVYKSSGQGLSGVWGNWSAQNTVDLTSYPNVVTVIATIEYANESKLYVNGTLISTVSISGTNTKPYIHDSTAKFTGLTISERGSSSSQSPMGMAATFKTVAAFIYSSILTQQQVTDRYNALMIGSSPLETGYAKELLLDHPKFYFRMRDIDGSLTFKNWLHPNTATHDLTIFNPSVLNFNQSSPVAGSSSIQFNGTSGARGKWVSSSTTSRRELSFGCIITPIGTPSEIEVIVRLHQNDDVMFASLSRQINGCLMLEVRAAGATETYNFTTALTAGTTYTAVATINKVTQTAKLYLNKVLVETLSSNAILLDVAVQTLSDQAHYCLIGGIPNTALTAVTNKLNAKLTEVAFYAYELPASRVTAQYDAMPIL